MESHGLMGVCLKKIHALTTNQHHHGLLSGGGSSSGSVGKLKLVDASWVWTEPHCMRLKVRVTVQANVLDDAIAIRQRAMVEFFVRWKQCSDCNKEFTNNTWHSIVQVRQKRPHVAEGSVSRGLMVLEMALAKAKHARRNILDLKTVQNGFDFYFSRLDKAQSFASFIAKAVPMRIKISSKLVSTDVKNNTANIKTTVVCDMVPICKDDLVVCDKRSKDGGAGTLCGKLALVTKVSSVVHLMDACPTRGCRRIHDIQAELVPEKYWRNEKYYRIALTPKRMTRFIVLDVELCKSEKHEDDSETLYKGPQSGIDKYSLADVEVAREADFGVNDETYFVITHLGNLLNVGDYCLGYDLTASMNDEISDISSYNKGFEIPDVVLVRKIQGSTTSNEVVDESNYKNTTDVDLNEGKGKKAKSRKSKRRERRREKEEAKDKAYVDTIKRMGLDEDTRNDRKNDFEKELMNDPDLAEELKVAEEIMECLDLEEQEGQEHECIDKNEINIRGD